MLGTGEHRRAETPFELWTQGPTAETSRAKLEAPMTHSIDLIVPVVHLGGTDKQDLVDQLIEADNALRKALQALSAAAPHARDYAHQCIYAGEQYRRARGQHDARYAKL